MLTLFREQANEDRLEVKLYIDIFYEFLKFFQLFGSALYLGFVDVRDKADQLKANQELMSKLLGRQEDKDRLAHVNSFIDMEFELGLQNLNGNSYRSALSKFDGESKFLQSNKNPLYYYQSVSWVVIRGAWFYDFLSEIMNQLDKHKDKSMSQVAGDAYNLRLRKRHPWIVQKAVGVGLHAICDRKTFFDRLIES